jgi:hypothetical protein
MCPSFDKKMYLCQKRGTMKNLPIGIQSFEKLREGNFLYVDKTEIIYQLISSGSAYFLSRPRRFGKSLLISTLESVFKGQKELFKGLWIEDKVDWTQLNHPVIRLDFGGINNDTPENLQKDLESVILKMAQHHNITLTRTGAGSFAELIEQLHQVTSQQVVVLIDEYDKPISDHLTDLEVATANRVILHDFYQVLKPADEHLRFLFLTGVSKFSKVSIFSGLNHLNDITIDYRYPAICGYTQQELEDNFSEYIPTLSEKYRMSDQEIVDAIRQWYDGYSWDGTTAIYNPFSTLLIFDKREFSNYWFSTGTPTFLIKLLMKRDQLEPILEPLSITAEDFNSFDPQNISEIPLLFQTGYLTIKKKEIVKFDTRYTIEMPNLEVKESLLQYLLSAYSHYPVERGGILMERMQKQLLANDASGLEKSLREMLAHVPNQLHIGKESYYHSLLLVWLKLLGFNIIGEVNTNKGRIDAVWTLKDQIIIAEIKYSPQAEAIDTMLDAATKQIREKHYTERYENGQTVSLLAVAFAGKEIGCRIEAV